MAHEEVGTPRLKDNEKSDEMTSDDPELEQTMWLKFLAAAVLQQQKTLAQRTRSGSTRNECRECGTR